MLFLYQSYMCLQINYIIIGEPLIMGLRFRRSLKIAPGIKLNFNKNSRSITFGARGAHYTINSKGKRTSSVGIPGTGLSYSTTTTKKKRKKTKETPSDYYLQEHQESGLQDGIMHINNQAAIVIRKDGSLQGKRINSLYQQ